jgi:hypothetical protein
MKIRSVEAELFHGDGRTVLMKQIVAFRTFIHAPMGWTVRGSNPGGGRILRTCPDRPWDPPGLLYNE